MSNAPFEVKDCALIALATGRRAQNIRELKEILRSIDADSVYYHFWGTLLRPRFDNPQYHNDFAIWIAHQLHDKVLAERLALLDPTDFDSVDQLRGEIIEILEERARVLELMDNQSKELDFLLKNRLVFMLQKNIVKNKTDTKYRKWFEFAQKTKNPDNKEEDFQEYMDDEIFREIIRKINKNELTEDDLLYIENETKIREEVERFEKQIYEDGLEKGKKGNAFEVAGKLKAKGFDDEIIAEVTGLSLDEISRL